MRKIILILTIFFVGCNQKSNDIEDVEIMTYNRDFDSNSNSIFRVIDYSIIQENGDAKSINYRHFDNQNKFIKYEVNQKILNEISIKTRNLNDKYFVLKEEDFANEIFCGLNVYTRYRIRFKNRESITFVYLNRKLKTKKYSDFLKLKQEFEVNKSKGYKIANQDTLNLIRQAELFKVFATSFKDNLLYPVRPQEVKPVRNITSANSCYPL